MKIPAIKAKIGNWDYYLTTLTFDQVTRFVSKIDDQLHRSESLKDLIQRSITNNYVKIKEYILHQEELFFNSLVLAVYDNYPNWEEVVMRFGENEYFNMGFLDFPSEHKIFPVDGQHRVEGIKASLLERPELGNEKIGAIFIGHRNDDSGKEKTRRLFTTLNRYAKPVSTDDIIALDEDDIVAITTRHLLENYDLFTKKRVVYAKQKAIPTNNKDAITSIITLYQANLELFKLFYGNKFRKKATKTAIDDYLRFRPANSIIGEFSNYVNSYWDSFKRNLSFINRYLEREENVANTYRNAAGGNLVFRPIGFLPLVQSSIIIKQRTDATFDQIYRRFNDINLELDTAPWHYVIWDPVGRKMLMNASNLTVLLLTFLYGDNILNERELIKLEQGYSAKIAEQGEHLNLLRSMR